MITGTKGASFSHRGSSYLVETRSRVIIFDIAAFESDRTLIRGPSSFVSPVVDHPHRSPSGEHSGFMSWPEHFQKANPEGIDQQANSLSARAMQLSIYGSMVCSVSLSCSLVLWDIMVVFFIFFYFYICGILKPIQPLRLFYLFVGSSSLSIFQRTVQSKSF